MNQYRINVVFGILIVFFIFLQLFRLPVVPILFEGDHSVHLSNAFRMYQGEMPFSDFFIFTFPGTETIYLALFKLVGVKIWILNAVILSLLFGLSAICFYFSSKLLKGWAVYLPVLIFTVIGVRPLGIDGSHRFFSVFFVLLATAIIFNQRSVKKLFLAGLMCGLASCFTQPRGLVGVAAIVVFLIYEEYTTGKKPGNFLRSLFSLIIPYGFIIFLTCFYFISTAGFDSFYYSTFIFPVKNYPADVWNNFGAYLRDVPTFGQTSFISYLKLAAPILLNYILIPLVYFVFFGVYLIKYRSISSTLKNQLVLLNLTGLFLALGIASAPTSTRLFQISIPGLIILIWIFQYYFNPQKTFAVFAVLLFLLGFSYSIQRQTTQVFNLETPSGQTVVLTSEIRERYLWAAENTKPSDYLYEPHHPSLYWIFHLKNPTPLPLIRANNYTTSEQVFEVVKGLKTNPPEFIIWNGVWDSESSTNSPGFHLQPLVDFLHENYHQTSQLNNFKGINENVEYEIVIWEKN